MKFYVLVTTFAHDYPEASRPRLFTDRDLAGLTWSKQVIEDVGESDNDDTRIEMIQALAVDWCNDPGDEMPLEWIVGGEGPLNEQHQVQLFTVSLSQRSMP